MARNRVSCLRTLATDGKEKRRERKGRDPFNLGGSKRRGALRRRGTATTDA